MTKKGLSGHRLAQSISGHSAAVFVLVALATYTVTTHGPAMISMIASSATSLVSPSATILFTPYGEKILSINETADIDITLTNRTPINVVAATITFPPDALEIVGISKKNSFLDLWTEDTVIREETGEVHFSGGTTKRGGQSGTGTILTLSVRAKKIGDATLSVKDVQVFASDGKGGAVDTDIVPFTYSTPTTTLSASIASGSGTPSSALAQSADFNDDGKVSIADMSILAVKMLSPFDTRYDLNGDGRVNIGDLSVLFAKM